MKTLINKTRAPIKIVLPGGKALRLGPGKAGQIRDEDADADAVKKLVEAGALEMHHGGGHAAGGGTSGGGLARGGGYGHSRATFRQRKGER